jgi:hypothetical protein
MIHTGGGTFDPHEENVYFLASNTERQQWAAPMHNHLLLAVNELESADSMAYFERVVNDPTKKIFLDSGVFSLAMNFARKYNVSHDVALSTAPDEIDGFKELFEKYVDLVRTYGNRLWGYIEIDQGGRDNKIKTRAKLEALGLRPIPVYHPMSDGWDYFDYLASRYDRMCFGNIVKANGPTRLRLLATAWERHRKYPSLWIHLLGLTPNQWLDALPINSGDSSSWLAPVRWPTFPVSSDGCVLGQLGVAYRYKRGTDPDAPDGSRRCARLSAYMSHMNMKIWRRHMNDLADLGYQKYPAMRPGEHLRRANEVY